jgi:small neutral amino acid transporter SnatA (MarC family)
MDQASINAAGAIDTFLVLLIGVGPKLALVPFVEITASLDPATKRRVLRKMLTTVAVVAVVLMALGELLRALLHFTIGSLVDRRWRDLARAGGVDGPRATR